MRGSQGEEPGSGPAPVSRRASRPTSPASSRSRPPAPASARRTSSCSTRRATRARTPRSSRPWRAQPQRRARQGDRQVADCHAGQQRAAAVAHYLFDEYGLDPVRVLVTSAGDTRPVGDNATAEGRRQNRRVEILVYPEQVSSATEVRQRLPSRKLTEDQRAQLLQTLREDPKIPLTVVSLSGDNESHAFAQKLDMLFDIAGWPTQGVSQQTVRGVPPGLTFVAKRGDALVVAQAARLQVALHAMGIMAQSSALESMPQGLLMLVVGPHPP